jgi:hypothetical protein
MVTNPEVFEQGLAEIIDRTANEANKNNEQQSGGEDSINFWNAHSLTSLLAGFSFSWPIAPFRITRQNEAHASTEAVMNFCRGNRVEFNIDAKMSVIR